MKYALGNMLNGAGSLNPDGLSLDLQFAADRTLTARKGPTPAFTRGSGATQVGATGLIEYAPENLILYSNNVEDAAWTKEDGTITSSAETINGLTAEVFNENSANAVHRFYRMHDGFAGVISTFSVWLKAAGRRYVSVNLGANGPNTNSKLVLDLVDRVVIAGTTGVTTSILLENNGWARYSFTFVPRVNSGSMPIQSNFSSTVVSENGVGLNGAAFYVAGQQYERASIARAYIPTTTAEVYGPRFDHNPTSPFACRGLLIEEGRTNFLLQSENFASNASWGKTNSSISETLHTAPTGALTANELVEDMLLAAHTCVQSGPTATIGTTYTFSIFVKRKPSSNQFLLIGATGLVVASFISVNLTNGATSTGIGSPAAPINVSSTAYPDGWYRVQFSVVATSAAVSTLDIRLSRDGTWANRAYLGDGVQSSLIWGAQLEVGAFPTSYIPTTTGTATRSADVCSITEGAFSGFYNQPEGTFFASAMIANLVGENRGIAQIDNGDNPHHIRIGYGNTSGGFHNSVRANDTTTQLGNNAGSANVSQKLIISYQGTSYAGTVNGATVTTTTRTQPTGLSTLRIGSLAGPFYTGGHISAIRFYKKRLPNSKLQALTAP